MILNRDEYLKKVHGCWIGKNIGGTLGAPFEWKRQVNNVSFYATEFSEPLPNDDLDLQLLWLICLEERGVGLNAQMLAEFWMVYVAAHWSEYGVTKANMRAGLLPPLSGLHNNPFKDSCGAMCRVEIWACIAPGSPRVAARYACTDASLDHGNGEGTFAAVFCAAVESAAFVEQDFHKLVELGLSYVPAECGVARAVHTALEWHRTGKTWRETRDEILRRYRGLHRPYRPEIVSAEDQAKGFGDGKLGYDAPSNIGMIVIGLLYGGGDFEKSLSIVVNCGEDTDTTAATVGSIFGIMHGLDAIPAKWTQPIGRNIKTMCLNIGDLSVAGKIALTTDELTERTERIAQRVVAHERLAVEIADKPTDRAGLSAEGLRAGPAATKLYESLGGPVFGFDFFDVGVDYGGDPTIRDGVPRNLTLRIYNRYSIHRTEIYSLQANLNVRWLAPERPEAPGYWKILPSRVGQVFSWKVGANPAVAPFVVQIERVESHTVRAAIEITMEGRPGVMLVPVMFVNGNLAGVGAAVQS